MVFYWLCVDGSLFLTWFVIGLLSVLCADVLNSVKVSALVGATLLLLFHLNHDTFLNSLGLSVWNSLPWVTCSTQINH